jgi:hypothetical protein
MARYEHLPIYRKAMDLTICFENIVRNFSRYNKYTLGSELREKSREIVELIIKTNPAYKRIACRRDLFRPGRLRKIIEFPVIFHPSDCNTGI